MKENHISFCTDENYASYTGVAMTSIILNNRDIFFCFHILYNTLKEDDKRKFLLMSQRYDNVEIKLYDLSGEKKTALYKITNRYPRTVYLRWYVPDLIDPSIKRIIYLDGDVLCLGSLKELLTFEFSDEKHFALAAVGKTQSLKEITRLKLTQDKTINAGVLLINLPEWRKQQLSSKLFDFAECHSEELLWLDNDVLNRVLDGNFYMLAEKWNHRLYLQRMPDNSISPDDVIIHYSGTMKPWHENCLNKDKEIWWRYSRESLWNGITPLKLGSE